MRLRLTLMLVLLVSLIVVPACASSEERTKAEEDKIVVECAEQILLDFSYTYIPPWGYESPEDSHEAFLIELATDDIFLFEDEHPFEEFDNYIAFKAGYYREWFSWGNLPPEDIMEQCGIEPPQE
jgi:hypothetical protein